MASDLDTSWPSREELQSVVEELTAERIAGASLLQAAKAKADQDEAALRDITAERDSWRNAAQALQTELWRQIDVLRAELGEHPDQIQHLVSALQTLVELAEGKRTGTAPGGADASPEASAPHPSAKLAELPPLPPIPVPPAPTPKSTAAPSPPIPVRDVPADLAPDFDDDLPPGEIVPPDRDRVGIITELAAVAVDSVPAVGHGSAKDRALKEGFGPAEPNGGRVDILPTAETEPKKRLLPRRM
jgi:hypothetical protein